jgi:hypothetical protein
MFPLTPRPSPIQERASQAPSPEPPPASPRPEPRTDNTFAGGHLRPRRSKLAKQEGAKEEITANENISPQRTNIRLLPKQQQELASLQNLGYSKEQAIGIKPEKRPGVIRDHGAWVAQGFTHAAIVSRNRAPSPGPMKPVSKVLQKNEKLGGWDCTAQTALGNEVMVWVPSENNLPQGALQEYHYPKVQEAHNLVLSLSSANSHCFLFCHGHAFDTFERFGYSVYGGCGLEQVLKDEFTLVGEQSLQGARAGDIVVWWEEGLTSHSVKLEVVPLKNPTPETTKVSSKDTFWGFSHRWLKEFAPLGNDWKVFRHRIADVSSECSVVAADI